MVRIAVLGRRKDHGDSLKEERWRVPGDGEKEESDYRARPVRMAVPVTGRGKDDAWLMTAVLSRM